MIAGCAFMMKAQPVGSIPIDSLQEVVVTAVGPVKGVSQDEAGSISLTQRGLSEAPSFMGSRDPLAMLRSMPAVATNNDLRASMNVRGTASGSNSWYADGVRIGNPLHILGFYSGFNPDFFQKYEFRPGYIPASYPNTSGAFLEASSATDVAARFSGKASVGLIESHFGLSTPIVKDRLSVALGGRLAYPSKIFPDLLKMGSSSLQYGFGDANIALTGRLTDRDILKVSAFFDRDNLDVSDRRQGVKEGFFRWMNIAAGASWMRSSNEVDVYFSRYTNRLRLDQGSQTLDLPSGLTEAAARCRLALPAGFHVGGDVNWRRTQGIHNSALKATNGVAPQEAFEANAAAEWRGQLGRQWRLEGGLRLSVYTSGGYTAFFPQPRVAATFKLPGDYFISAAYQRLMRFDRLIESSGGGLPSDFWISASSGVKPEDVNSFELGAGGMIPWIGANFRIDLYAKRILHASDYVGTVLDLLSPSYDAEPNIVDARGWARGISISLMRQFGRVRGRIGYNLGKTTLRAERFGDDPYPAPYDRTHDLNVALTWQPWNWLQISASYVYATGLPYTRAKYGYMIGENLICEYYPHNSSRLPDYNRLDMAVSWKHTSSRGLGQEVTVSVYNVLGSKNVLFEYMNYSIADGISHKESVMNMVIPSITYTISFR